MNNFSKLFVLFFAIVLTISTGTANFGGATPKLINVQEDGATSTSYLSAGKLTIFGLPPSVEHIGESVIHFPAPDSKIHQSNSSAACLFSVEQRIQSIARQYFFRSNEIVCGLSIRDIIFPFHYFW